MKNKTTHPLKDVTLNVRKHPLNRARKPVSILNEKGFYERIDAEKDQATTKQVRLKIPVFVLQEKGVYHRPAGKKESQKTTPVKRTTPLDFRVKKTPRQAFSQASKKKQRPNSANDNYKVPVDHERNQQRHVMERLQREELYAFEKKASDRRYKADQTINKYYQPQAQKEKLHTARQALKQQHGWFSKLTGKPKRLQEKVKGLERNLKSIHARQAEMMGKVKHDIAQDRTTITKRQTQEKNYFENNPLVRRGTSKSFETARLDRTIAKPARSTPTKAQTRQRS